MGYSINWFFHGFTCYVVILLCKTDHRNVQIYTKRWKNLMLGIYKYYKYQKNKAYLKKILIEKFGTEKGMKKYNEILKNYKHKKKVEM